MISLQIGPHRGPRSTIRLNMQDKCWPMFWMKYVTSMDVSRRYITKYCLTSLSSIDKLITLCRFRGNRSHTIHLKNPSSPGRFKVLLSFLTALSVESLNRLMLNRNITINRGRRMSQPSSTRSQPKSLPDVSCGSLEVDQAENMIIECSEPMGSLITYQKARSE